MVHVDLYHTNCTVNQKSINTYKSQHGYLIKDAFPRTFHPKYPDEPTDLLVIPTAKHPYPASDPQAHGSSRPPNPKPQRGEPSG